MDEPQLQDQLLVTYVLQQVVKYALDCDLLYQNNIDDQVSYPFVTYNFVMPEQDTTGDWLGNGRQYLVHLQIDCHATDALSAMTMAQRLYADLHDEAYRRWFEQVDVTPQSITDTSDRTILEGINYDYRFGFDCSFLIGNGGVAYDPDKLDFTFSPDIDIRSVHANDIGDQASVDVKKKEKEN